MEGNLEQIGDGLVIQMRLTKVSSSSVQEGFFRGGKVAQIWLKMEDHLRG